MPDITSYISQTEEEYELLRCAKRRNIEQKFLYSQDGADKYYSSADPSYDFNSEDFTTNDFISFVENVLKEKESNVIISLGCGEAKKEAEVMKILKEKGYNICLIAIDSSREMLELACDNLKSIGIDYQLIHADITSLVFQKSFAETIKDYNNCIFSLLGGTLGNMVQTEIVDTLYNLAKINTYVWIDVLAREKKEKIDQIKLFKEYLKRLEIPSEVDFYFTPLKKLGLSKDSGVMRMYGTTEDSIGSQKFRFSFEITEPTSIMYLDQKIHLLPPESIKLMDIRVYHADTLISFFEAHDFALLKTQYKYRNGQFLFQKK